MCNCANTLTKRKIINRLRLYRIGGCMPNSVKRKKDLNYLKLSQLAFLLALQENNNFAYLPRDCFDLIFNYV